MTGPEITAAMIDALNASGIPYLLAGSFSSSYYGLPYLHLDTRTVLGTHDRVRLCRGLYE